MALMIGATHVIQWPVQRASKPARGSKSQKAGRSPDRSLQLDCVKSESLVIADQHVAVNTFPGLVHTARQTMEAEDTRSRLFNPQGKAATKVCFVTGVKS